VLEDGKANEGFRVMRLKNKIGDRSNASSEVEYHDAVGYLIGEHGRGVRTIMDMVALTRLDCATGSAGIMRSAVFSAGLHVSQRKAFGKNLLHQPSMANVLADLEVECEAATHMALAAAAALGCDAGAAELHRRPRERHLQLCCRAAFR
jgi:putative acyl-CoA dehydrogenase